MRIDGSHHLRRRTSSALTSLAGVHSSLVLGGITDETLALGEGDVRGGGTVTLVVGNNFNTVILPDTDTTVEEKMSVKSDRTDRIQSTYE